MSEKLFTLEEWARERYGERPPFIGTVRRWAREGKIYPLPQKQGRAYFVVKSAQYVDDYNNSSFLEKMSVASKAQ